MSPEIEEDKLIEILNKRTESKYGLICINSLIENTPKEILDNLIKKYNITTEKEIFSKVGLLLAITKHFYNEFESNPEIKSSFLNVFDFIGYLLLNEEMFQDYSYDYDIISKQELIDIFSDFCADIGISVFDASNIDYPEIDLYLTRKTPILRTEASFVRPGIDLSEDEYSRVLSLIDKTLSFADWMVFTTTPYGVYRIGFSRIIEDMEARNVWTYVVDPIKKQIYGITKGKKSDAFSKENRDDLIKKLPRESIRAPSQVKKISQFQFDEGISYNPKKYSMFGIMCEEEYKNSMLLVPTTKKQVPKYRDRFKNLLLIDKDAGIPLMNYSNIDNEAGDSLISSFLSAMDTFIQQLGGDSILEDINYQGLYIQAAYGELVKIALFLSKPSDKIIKQRLAFFIRYIEQQYFDQITEFKKTGEISLFNNEDFTIKAQRFLEI